MFFAAMCVIMTVTVYGFYPETKGLGIEETPAIFKKHWWAVCLDTRLWLSDHDNIVELGVVLPETYDMLAAAAG